MEYLIYSDLVGGKLNFEDDLGKEGRTPDAALLVKQLNEGTAKILFIMPKDKVNNEVVRLVYFYGKMFSETMKTHEAGNAMIIFTDMKTYRDNADIFIHMAKLLQNAI